MFVYAGQNLGINCCILDMSFPTHNDIGICKSSVLDYFLKALTVYTKGEKDDQKT